MLIFFAVKDVTNFCTAIVPHNFSAKNGSVLVYNMFEILTTYLLTTSFILMNWAQEV